jgi:hypothetical protein
MVSIAAGMDDSSSRSEPLKSKKTLTCLASAP